MARHFSTVLLASALAYRAQAHGAVTKPFPRKVANKTWCPWCVGEHQPLTNPYGQVHHDAQPSSPCMGSARGDEPYEAVNFPPYTAIAGAGPQVYVPGTSFEATIVLDADHNGEAQWGYCPHSEPETEDCFRRHPLTDWTDVHAYWGGDSSRDHWKDKSHFPQTVQLPADMPTGPATLRWLWVCKFTDEIFVSCIDAQVSDSASASPAPATSPPPLPVPTQPGPLVPAPTGAECIWTEPAGREVTRSPREEKDGRTCWDFEVEAGTTVHYQSKTDVYITWNTQACCFSAASPFGSADGAPPNIVSFTPSGGSFGFCECSAWDPRNPGTSCAGQAVAGSMICPVQGGADGMCSDAATYDGLPVRCNGSYVPTPATSTTGLATQAPAPPASSTTPTPSSSSTPSSGGSCAGEWQKCGGKDWSGTTCCTAGLVCTVHNEHHSECQRGAPPSGACSGIWEQCGGKAWDGATCCAAGLMCRRLSADFSQCEPDSAALAEVRPHAGTGGSGAFLAAHGRHRGGARGMAFVQGASTVVHGASALVGMESDSDEEDAHGAVVQAGGTQPEVRFGRGEL